MREFEPTIKKDIRNRPIVREVDRARQRELWRFVGVAGFLVVVLLFSAWLHFELLRHGYQLEQMQQERARQLEINRHLRLEVETLRSPGRIEQIATEQLNLIVPSNEDAVIVERHVQAVSAPEERSAVVADAVSDDVVLQP